MRKIEKETFWQLCRFVDADEKALRSLLMAGGATPTVLGLLFTNRMAGIADTVLQNTGLYSLVDREFRASLCHAKQQNQAIWQEYENACRYVAILLNSAGVRYAMLKGAVLCGQYPRGCRTSSDIDLLTTPQEISRMEACLLEHGFQQGYVKNGMFVPAIRKEILSSRVMRGETVPFIKEMGGDYYRFLEVDINFSLDFKNSRGDGIQKLLEKSVEWDIGGVKAKTLCREDFFLHLCAHLYKEATTIPWIRMKRDMSLYKYADIYFLLRSIGVDMPSVISRAKELNLCEECYYALHGTGALFGISVDALLGLLPVENKNFLHQVVAPQEKKIYRYTEENERKRFFCSDRMKLLKEETVWNY